MCGIAGILTQSRIDDGVMRRMTRSIAHRGPDDEGAWIDAEAGVALGNRRLSIIDTSPAGHQPMHSSDRRYVFTFNGEIYNHPELRAELEACGAAPQGGWRGHCDTETFLAAIAAWGLEKALEKSHGMFAFALWDRERRTLRLVRDPFGEKPLYYGWAGKDFLFASELKAFRAHPQFTGEIDRRAVTMFAARGYVPAPLSIYRDVYKLEPGCILTLSVPAAAQRHCPRVGESTSGISLDRYWSYREVLRAGLRNPITSEADATDELERVLSGAISSQSLADVPVGAFLSGGIDSSTVVALYQKYSSQPVRTFTIGFDAQGFNEAEDARRVAQHFGTEHNDRTVTASDALEVVPRLPHIYDEPFADSSQIPTLLVSEFAREQVKVALSGDGGDELFGGYNRYFGTARMWTALNHLPGPLRAAIARPFGLLPPAAWNGLGQLASAGRVSPFFGEKVRKSLRMIGRARCLDELFTAFLDEWADEGSPVIGANPDERCASDLDLGPGAPDPLRMMYADAVSYLPDDILCKVDRASMAVGLEVHVPMLDRRVAAVAARIPLHLNIHRGGGKLILKKLLYREAPPALFDRPKSGFAIPVGEWIKGPLRPWAEDLLDAGALRAAGWFRADEISRRWHDHLAGRRDSTAALWSILMFQAWLREQNNVVAAAA